MGESRSFALLGADGHDRLDGGGLCFAWRGRCGQAVLCVGCAGCVRGREAETFAERGRKSAAAHMIRQKGVRMVGRIEVGDLVVRLSHGGDIIFKVTDVTADGTYVLKGLHLRLLADAPRADLALADARLLRDEIVREETAVREMARRIFERRSRQREERSLMRAASAKKYSSFDVPGRVLHLDGDAEYLRMCLKTYRQLRIEAVGRCVDEEAQPALVDSLLREHRPDILVLTGHDAILGGGRKKLTDLASYRNSRYFIEGVRKARLFEPSRDELVIFAGACQSYFEGILAAGANYASAPNRIFIHAYDPVFIAEKVAFTSIGRTVDISDAIGASVTGAEGVGGIETRGKLRIGMPRISYHS